MGAARFEFLALLVAALAYFYKRIDVVEIVVFVGLAWLIGEVAGYRLRKKIEVWPSDKENCQRVIDLVASNATMDEIMSLEFGRARGDLLDVLRKIAQPEIQESYFHDSDLSNSYRYLQAKAKELLLTVDSEMFQGATAGWVEIPLEWKRYGAPLYGRYRDAQKTILKQSKDLIEAIKAFANCYQGAGRRL